MTKRPLAMALWLYALALSLAPVSLSQRGPRPLGFMLAAGAEPRRPVGPFDLGKMSLVVCVREPTEAEQAGGAPAAMESIHAAVEALSHVHSWLKAESTVVVLTSRLSRLETVDPGSWIRTEKAPLEENQEVQAQWCVDGWFGLWLLGPRGEVLGAYAREDIDALSIRVDEVLLSRGELEAHEAVARINQVGDCWRYAFDALTGRDWRPIASRLRASLAGVERSLWDLSRKATDIEAETAAVRIASAAFAHDLAQQDLPPELQKALKNRRLISRCPELKVVNLWRSVCSGELSDDKFVRSLTRGVPGALLENLISIYRLRLRGPLIARCAMEILEGARPTDWRTQSMAIRILAEQTCRGWGKFAPDDYEPLGIQRSTQWETHPSWQVRWAVAELYGSMPIRWCAAALVDMLAAEEQSFVLDGCVDALERLTGQHFGDSPAPWRRWLAEEGDDWNVHATTLVRWVPPPPSFVEMPDAAGNRLLTDGRHVSDSAAKGAFRTDVDHVVYALDASASMRPGFGAEVHRQLEAQFQRFNEEQVVGVVTYSDRATALKTPHARPALKPANGRTKASLLSAFGSISLTGRTNFSAAIEAAFRFDEIEEVFLLSDGSPSVGDRLDEAGLVAALDEANLVIRARFSTVLVVPGMAYFIEDLKGKEMPLPRDKDRLRWHAERDHTIGTTPNFHLLDALAKAYRGHCRTCYANQLFSRNGVPIND